LTELAELALDAACELAFAELDSLYCEPLVGPSEDDVPGRSRLDAGPPPDLAGEKPRRAHLWVVGMGKLGARELNVSSDIDLIYVYDHDGETAGNSEGRNRISNHEYFGKAVKHIYNTVGETTEHGNVFRVDLALR